MSDPDNYNLSPAERRFFGHERYEPVDPQPQIRGLRKKIAKLERKLAEAEAIVASYLNYTQPAVLRRAERAEAVVGRVLKALESPE